MFELIFTSAPKGLFPGKSGFSTVAMTKGMPPNLIAPLENLSGYNFTYCNSELPRELNPVSCYYIQMRYGNQQMNILGRIAPNGLDHSNRNNKIAHHIFLESAEELQSANGAADFFINPAFLPGDSNRLTNGVFIEDFKDHAPCELARRELPACYDAAGEDLRAHTWQSLTGDAGTAGWAAEKFRENEEAVYIKFPAGTDVKLLLELTREVCALLDENEKKSFTFNTYFSNIAAGTRCFLRFIPDFSPLAGNIERFHRDLLIDLCSNQLPQQLSLARYAESTLVDIARNGIRPDSPPDELCAPPPPETVEVNNDFYVQQPEAPEMPDVPETPDVPDMPDVPSSPEKIRIKNQLSPSDSAQALQASSITPPQRPARSVMVTEKAEKSSSNLKNYIGLAAVAIAIGVIIFYMITPVPKDDDSKNKNNAAETSKVPETAVNSNNKPASQAANNTTSISSTTSNQPPRATSQQPSARSQQTPQAASTQPAATTGQSPQSEITITVDMAGRISSDQECKIPYTNSKFWNLKPGETNNAPVLPIKAWNEFVELYQKKIDLEKKVNSFELNDGVLPGKNKIEKKISDFKGQIEIPDYQNAEDVEKFGKFLNNFSIETRSFLSSFVHLKVTNREYKLLKESYEELYQVLYSEDAKQEIKNTLNKLQQNWKLIFEDIAEILKYNDLNTKIEAEAKAITSQINNACSNFPQSENVIRQVFNTDQPVMIGEQELKKLGEALSKTAKKK